MKGRGGASFGLTKGRGGSSFVEKRGGPFSLRRGLRRKLGIRKMPLRPEGTAIRGRGNRVRFGGEFKSGKSAAG